MKRKLFITAAVLAAGACRSGPDKMSDELKTDLAVAASNDGLELISGGSVKQQVISQIEQAPPAPGKFTASARAVRHTQAKSQTSPPQDEIARTASEDSAFKPAENVQIAAAADAPVAPRPRPQSVQMPGGGGEGRGGYGAGSSGVGIGIEIMGVVLRGGGVGDDHCEPAGPSMRRPPRISINNRIPVIRGTFPGRQ